MLISQTDASMDSKPCSYTTSTADYCHSHGGYLASPSGECDRAGGLPPMCWCGGEVGHRVPGDASGLGCLDDISHNWSRR